MQPGHSRILVRDVVCRFGDKTALDGVDLTVAPGEIHALLGPNGAGKTTLTRVLCGLVKPEQGSVATGGAVGLVPSGDRSFYLRISTLENLIFFARLHGLRLREARRRSRELLEAVGLTEAEKRPVGKCSHGMQKRLSVARAILVRPAVLLVDEATHDLDPEGARRIRALIRDQADLGTAVLWTTQRVEEINDFAVSATLLVRGRVAFSGSPAQLAAQAPTERYLVQVHADADGVWPPVAALQLAVGPSARVIRTQDPGHFLLVPRDSGDLGVAVARLVGAGMEVVSCRQAQSDMEEAFLALTAGGVA